MELALGIAWLLFAIYFALHVYADYRTALAAGGYSIASGSGARDMIAVKIAVAVLIPLVALLALAGLGIFPLAIGGAVLFAISLLFVFAVCHGCDHGGIAAPFGLALGGFSVAFVFHKPEGTGGAT